MMAGWGFPQTSRKAHYFQADGMALCRKWGFFRGPMQDDNHESTENCAECKRLHRRLAARDDQPTQLGGEEARTE